MRKIEAKMVEKVLAGEAWQGGHLTVRVLLENVSPTEEIKHVEVFSYAEKIGEYSPSENTLTLFPPSFRSATTKSHMNALLQGLGLSARVRQQKGAWVVDYPNAEVTLPFDSNFRFITKSLQSVH